MSMPLLPPGWDVTRGRRNEAGNEDILALHLWRGLGFALEPLASQLARAPVVWLPKSLAAIADLSAPASLDDSCCP